MFDVGMLLFLFFVWRWRGFALANWWTLSILTTQSPGYFEDSTPAIQVQTLPLEGPCGSLGNARNSQKKSPLENSKPTCKRQYPTLNSSACFSFYFLRGRNVLTWLFFNSMMQETADKKTWRNHGIRILWEWWLGGPRQHHVNKTSSKSYSFLMIWEPVGITFTISTFTITVSTEGILQV